MTFDFKKYRRDLDLGFFHDSSVIRSGSEEHADFWKFCDQYCAVRAKAAGKTSNLKRHRLICIDSIASSRGRRWTVDDAVARMPIRDYDSSRPPIPKRAVEEFADIITTFLDFAQKEKFKKLRKLRESQSNLPIAEYEGEIVEKVKTFPVVLIAGDTGCGKSTQVPQYLLKAGFSRIACTQPRRIACISLCNRVAFETLNEYADEVGFQIRFEKSKTKATKILFLTEGLLLRQIAGDASLSMYDVIVLDEVHERHLHGDFLLGILKCLIFQRPNLKVVLMSATINIELFCDYFSNLTPVIQVPGRLYPIQVFYREISVEDKSSKKSHINPAPYIRILQMIDDKFPVEERGDVLVFLSGMAEITAISDAAKQYAQQSNRWIILQLHSTLSIEEQDKAFDIAPEGMRKCVLSTNIAETSITIDGIRFVVDSGKVKEMNFDPVCRMEKLQEFWISKASAEQRKGRAGRTGPGVCYRLYSPEDYQAMADFSTPEIMRNSLDALVLQMMSLGLPDPMKFPFIQPPDPSRLKGAVVSLRNHGAVDEKGKLTTVGNLLAQLPVDVVVGKLLINGCLFNRLENVLSLAAVLSVQSPFTNRSFRDAECETSRKALESNHGDPLTLLSLYSSWLGVKSQSGSGDTRERSKTSRTWCKRRGIEEQRLYEVTKMRDQFSQIVKESGLVEKLMTKEETSTERRMRLGERSMLHQWMKDYKRKKGAHGPGEGKKRRVLKARDGEVASDDEESNPTSGLAHEAKDVEFRMRKNAAQIQEIIESDKLDSFRDMIFVRVILTAAMYPQLALADDSNNYKVGTEQMFHCRDKPFTTLHPMGVFANNPDVLQLQDTDMVSVPHFPARLQVSAKHQLLLYLSLMETTRPFLMNTTRVPAAPSLFLFAKSIDTDEYFSRFVFDDWLEVRYPEPVEGMQMLLLATRARRCWKDLLDFKIARCGGSNIKKTDVEDCERELVTVLIQIYLNEAPYSIRRLLAADVKVLYRGPNATPFMERLECNPINPDVAPDIHPVRGGWSFVDYLTYDCLMPDGMVQVAEPEEGYICPVCDENYQTSPLKFLCHLKECGDREQQRVAKPRKGDESESGNFYCEKCKRRFNFSTTQILRHKKSHVS